MKTDTKTRQWRRPMGLVFALLTLPACETNSNGKLSAPSTDSGATDGGTGHESGSAERGAADSGTGGVHGGTADGGGTSGSDGGILSVSDGGDAVGTGGVEVSPGWQPGRPCPTTSAGTPGVWENVTPKGISLLPSDFNNGNYGIEDVVSDPIRSCELYAFTAKQGVWKSTDYGTTWGKLTAPGVLDGGYAWGEAIDPNPKRDPSTPPTLYACQGYDANGMFKSTDGGVTWVQLFVGNNVTTPVNPFGAIPDLYSIDIDPQNSEHLLATFHGAFNGYKDGGLIESMDGGKSWVLHYPPAGMGISQYVFFITSNLWLTIAQDGAGVWRTTTGGRVNGQPAPSAWAKVANFGHSHGCNQLFDAGKGEIYAAGADDEQDRHFGVFRSLDSGATWTQVLQMSAANAVFGTTKFIYTDFGWAYNGGPVDQTGRLRRAPRSDGTMWTDYYPKPPAGMINGTKRAAVVNDGTHSIIVSGMWNGGIWRYIEP